MCSRIDTADTVKRGIFKINRVRLAGEYLLPNPPNNIQERPTRTCVCVCTIRRNVLRSYAHGTDATIKIRILRRVEVWARIWGPPPYSCPYFVADVVHFENRGGAPSNVRRNGHFPAGKTSAAQTRAERVPGVVLFRIILAFSHPLSRVPAKCARVYST